VHESSIALSILQSLEGITSRKPNTRVKWIKLKIGRLRMIDEDSLKFALEVFSKGTRAEGMDVKIEWEDPLLKCNSCGYEWSANPKKNDLNSAHLYPDLLLQLQLFTCPSCGSTNYTIKAGRSLQISEVALYSEG